MLLEVDIKEAGYGKRPIISNIHLKCNGGDIVGIFGHNGAGKSTILKAIVGQLPYINGQLIMDGHQLAPNDKRSFGFVPQELGIFPSLTVEENLKIAALMTNKKDNNFDFVFDLFPILREKFSLPAGSLSGGQQQMLKISMALLKNPKAILLDEPSTGLAPIMVEKIMRTLEHIKNEVKIPIMLVEQNVNSALAIVDHLYVINTGKTVYDGNVKSTNLDVLWSHL
ncbi:ABC transporter ATP-binding protein [Paradesulfitobacterium aromaticivorans]